MRTKINLRTSPRSVIPWGYRGPVTSEIYNRLGRAGDALHASQRFKNFCYNLAVPKRRATHEGLFSVDGRAELVVSSSDGALVSKIVDSLKGGMTICGMWFSAEDVEEMPAQEFTDETVYRAISPLVAVTRERMLKYSDPEYMKTLVESMRHKAGHLGLKNDITKIEVLGVPKTSVTHNGHVHVPGALFSFTTDMDPGTMAVLVDAGIGAKCSQGFGFVVHGGFL